MNIKGWFPLGMTDLIPLLTNVTRFFQLKGNLKSHNLISPIFNMLEDSSKCFLNHMSQIKYLSFKLDSKAS